MENHGDSWIRPWFVITVDLDDVRRMITVWVIPVYCSRGIILSL